MAPSIESLCN